MSLCSYIGVLEAKGHCKRTPGSGKNRRRTNPYLVFVEPSELHSKLPENPFNANGSRHSGLSVLSHITKNPENTQ